MPSHNMIEMKEYIMPAHKPNPDPIDDLMHLLGNKTRRRILELLSKKPLYTTQLIDMLSGHPQSIVRHLKTLEQCGFVRSYERASFGGPPRKYYTIINARHVNVIIGPSTFSLKLVSGIIGQDKDKSSFTEHTASTSGTDIEITAFQMVLNTLSREKPTKAIEIAINVLESMKNSLIKDTK